MLSPHLENIDTKLSNFVQLWNIKVKEKILELSWEESKLSEN